MAKKDTTSIGFEDKIWKAADVLRGNLNASEYEGVVLGLIFLKYFLINLKRNLANSLPTNMPTRRTRTNTPPTMCFSCLKMRDGA